MKRTDAVWQRAFYLINNPQLQIAVKQVRKANNIPLNGFASERSFKVWKNKRIRSKKWNAVNVESDVDRAVAKIVNDEQYELTDKWLYEVKQYVYFNSIDSMPLTTTGMSYSSVFNELTGKVTLRITVPDDITRQDYINGWKEVKQWRKELHKLKFKRQTPADPLKLETSKHAYEMREQGASDAEIAQRLERKFGDAKHTFTPQMVNTIVNNFKKQVIERTR